MSMSKQQAKLKDAERHSVNGYGRQDICYNDPEGDFVFYSDYEALKKELEAAEKRIAELNDRTLTVNLVDCDFGAVQFMSGGSDDYCDGFVYGTKNAIKHLKLACAAAGIQLKVEE